MKGKFHLLMAVMALSTPLLSHAQSDGDFRSANQGRQDWNKGSAWDKYDVATTAWLNNVGSPNNTGIMMTTVRTGDTMTLKGTYKVQSLTIENGAAVVGRSGNNVGGYGPRLFRSANDTTILLNNGILGGDTTDGTNTKVELDADSTTYIVRGTGITRISDVRLSNSTYTNTNIIIDQDMILAGQKSGMAIGINKGNTTDNITYTITTGHTVTCTDTFAYLHGKSSTNYGMGGMYTYNIMGTLDMSIQSDTSMLVLGAGDTAAENNIHVNVGGKWILGEGIGTVNTDPAGMMGEVKLNILSGGEVVAPGNALVLGGHVFVMADSSAMLTRVVAAADTLFPIGTADTVVNSVMLKNTGTTDTISVMVKNVFSSADWTAANKAMAVNKTWYIKEAVAGGSKFDMKLAFVKDDLGANFSKDTANSLYAYNGTKWTEYPGAISGSGTMADPYWLTVAGVESFQMMFIAAEKMNPVGINDIEALSNSVVIAPNPVTGHMFNLNIAALESGKYQVNVFNLIGQNVYQNTINHTTGASQYRVNLPSSLAPGAYQVQIAGENGRVAKKIIVQ